MTDEYEFGVEEEEETEEALEEGSSRRKEGVKPVIIIIIMRIIVIIIMKVIMSFLQVKRLKGGRQLKSVRVRVEKLHGKRQVTKMMAMMAMMAMVVMVVMVVILMMLMLLVLIFFVCQPSVGHKLVPSWCLFFAPQRRKTFFPK